MPSGQKTGAEGELKMVVEQDLGVMEREKKSIEFFSFHPFLSQMDGQGGGLEIRALQVSQISVLFSIQTTLTSSLYPSPCLHSPKFRYIYPNKKKHPPNQTPLPLLGSHRGGETSHVRRIEEKMNE